MKYSVALMLCLTLVACGLDVKSATTKNNSGPVLGPATPSPTPGATPSAGETVYVTKCASCHALGSFDTSTSAGAPDLRGEPVSSVDARYPTPGAVGHQGVILSAAEISAVKTFIASK